MLTLTLILILFCRLLLEILTKCGMCGDKVNVITYAVFRDCRLRGVGVVRGVSLPSPIDLTCRPYNTGHTTVSVTV